MIDDIAEADLRSAAASDGPGELTKSARQSVLPEIVVRRDWIRAKTALSLEAILLVAIVTVAIGQGVWALA